MLGKKDRRLISLDMGDESIPDRRSGEDRREDPPREKGGGVNLTQWLVGILATLVIAAGTYNFNDLKRRHEALETVAAAQGTAAALFKQDVKHTIQDVRRDVRYQRRLLSLIAKKQGVPLPPEETEDKE